MTRPAPLVQWLDFLGLSDCPCPYAERTGRLYGVSIGPMWARMDTVGACRHHGDDAPPPVQITIRPASS